MKIKFLPFLVGGIFATSLFFSSCLNDDVEEIVLPAESSIQSFSIGTVSIEKVTKDSLGKDSTYIDTVSCAHYPFTIDQLKRTIENKDSLPVGSDVSRVLVKIEADSRAIAYEMRNKNGELKDTIWNETDSIDFTHPVSFKVFALNGLMGVPYRVTVNVHKQIPDTLEWSHYAAPTFSAGKLNKQKTVLLQEALYTLGTKSDGTAVIETLPINNVRGAAWKQLAALPANTNTYSAQSWKEQLFFVADGKLYRLSTNNDKGYEQVGTLTNLHTLVGVGNIAANQEVLFAYNKNKKMVALNADGSLAQNEELGFVDDKTFSSDRLTSACLQTRHNKSLTRTIVMSNASATDSIANVYGYTTFDDKWSKLSAIGKATCPNLENVSMIYYDNKLYAFGGGMPSKDIKPFKHFYSSVDNGLTWQEVKKCMVFPQEESAKHPDVHPFANYYTAGVEGSYSTTVDANHFIWIVWENGNVSKGRVNRLGFAKKW